eukprot:651784-Prorocentrum_minimum.AAC.1
MTTTRGSAPPPPPPRGGAKGSKASSSSPTCSTSFLSAPEAGLGPWSNWSKMSSCIGSTWTGE